MMLKHKTIYEQIPEDYSLKIIEFKNLIQSYKTTLSQIQQQYYKNNNFYSNVLTKINQEFKLILIENQSFNLVFEFDYIREKYPTVQYWEIIDDNTIKIIYLSPED